MSVAKGIPLIQYSQTYAKFTHTLGMPMDSLTSSFPTRIDSRGAPVDHARHTSSRADTYGAPQQSPGVTLSQDACTMLPVEVLSPAADVGALGGRVREVCEEYLLTGKHIDKPNLPAPALAERKQECELLRGRGYVQAPRDNVASYTAHHWVHTWIPGRNVAAVSVSGTSAAPGDHMAAAVPVAAPAAGYGHQPSARLLDATWPLRVLNHQGIPYYVDDASGRLFETPAADPWPLAVGELRGGAVYIASPQHNFFDLLDEYLKMTSSRLSDVFARFLVPGNESRGLERGGFTNFLREVIGAKMHLRAPQIDYFWAMLDVNSDGFVSNTELLAVAKDCRSVDSDMRMPDRRVAHAVLAEVQRAADALGSDGLVTLWQRLDSSGGMSRLDYVAAMRVAMEVRKQHHSSTQLVERHRVLFLNVLV